MKCIQYLNSYDEIAELVLKIQQRRIFNQGMLEHYRGQGRPEYRLRPAIARNCKMPHKLQNEEVRLSKRFIEEIKNRNLEDILWLDPNLSKDQRRWHVLMQMQHLGIPTRLLDWSLKWEVGLWFAVENRQNDDVDGQFWILSVPDEIHLNNADRSFYNKDIHRLNQTYFINSAIPWSESFKKQIAEVRKERQHGKFTISPYNTACIPLDEQPEVSLYIEKYGIPAKIKGQLRLELTAKGIHTDWLYYEEKDFNELKAAVDAVLNK